LPSAGEPAIASAPVHWLPTTLRTIPLGHARRKSTSFCRRLGLTSQYLEIGERSHLARAEYSRAASVFWDGIPQKSIASHALPWYSLSRGRQRKFG
jgi:hypothetical protein